MKQIAVVFWSGTGNTEEMANLIAAGAQAAGAAVQIIPAGTFQADRIAEFDAFAFGCSAQGDEVLEEDEFEPMFAGCAEKLSGKPVALFGSYGWGDGQWMRDWEARCADAGIHLCANSVICSEAPDADTAEACKALDAFWQKHNLTKERGC